MQMKAVIELCTHRTVGLPEVGDIVSRQEAGMPYVDEITAKNKGTESEQIRSSAAGRR